MKRACFLAVLGLLVLESNAVPSDVSCPTVIKRNSSTVHNCSFVQNSTTDISCQSYSVSKQGQAQFATVLNTVYYLKDQISEDRWCLGIREAKFSRLDHIPAGAINVFQLPGILTVFTKSILDVSAHVKFFGNAAAGFITLQPDCVNTTSSNIATCIRSINIASYIIAPSLGSDFTLMDFFGQKVEHFFFSKLQGRAEHVKLRTSGEAHNLKEWFPRFELSNIRQLDVSHNDLNGNLEHVLIGLDNLTLLNMSHCEITDIDKKNFEEGTPHLEVLNLSDNLLTSPPEGLSYLMNLTSLTLANQHTEIFKLGDRLSNLTNLKHLDLSNLALTAVTRESLPKSSQLEILDLSNCNLTYIPEDTFLDLPGLKKLKLNGNQLTLIKPGTFANLQRGAEIDLRGNLIQTTQKIELSPDVQVEGILYERLTQREHGRSLDDDVNSGTKQILPFNILVLFVIMIFYV